METLSIKESGVKQLRERTLQVYQFIADYINDKGYPPTIQEIADGVAFSKSNAYYHVQLLKDWQYIDYPDYSSRAIELLIELPTE